MDKQIAAPLAQVVRQFLWLSSMELGLAAALGKSRQTSKGLIASAGTGQAPPTFSNVNNAAGLAARSWAQQHVPSAGMPSGSWVLANKGVPAGALFPHHWFAWQFSTAMCCTVLGAVHAM